MRNIRDCRTRGDEAWKAQDFANGGLGQHHRQDRDDINPDRIFRLVVQVLPVPEFLAGDRRRYGLTPSLAAQARV
jgi:hypothetical protein